MIWCSGVLIASCEFTGVRGPGFGSADVGSFEQLNSVAIYVATENNG